MAYRHTIPRVEAIYTIILCILPAVFSLSNMYQQKSAAFNNAATGKTCYNFTEYRPKCGFKTIIKSPVPLKSVDFSDQVVEQLSNYTFITTNSSQWNGDHTNKAQGSCSDFNYAGSFGSNTPSLFVAWYCICDASTNQTCKMVYVENTTSSTTSSTLSSTLQTQQSSSTTMVMESSTFDSFTSISTSSTPAKFSTVRSSNIDESIDNTEGTPLISNSIVDITTGINPSVTSHITIYQPSLVSAANEDLSSMMSVYSSNTDQMLLINPATTDTTYTRHATTTDLYRSLITSGGTPSSVTRPTSNIISTLSTKYNHQDVITTNTLSTSEAITATTREVSQTDITTWPKTTPNETINATHDLRMVTSDPVSLSYPVSLSTDLQIASTLATRYTSADTFASVTVSTSESHGPTTELLLSSSEFFATNSMTTTYKAASESRLYTAALLVSSPGFFATVSMATISKTPTSFTVTSFTTATKLWSKSRTFQENTGTTAAMEEHLSSTPVGAEDATFTSTGIPLLSIISPPLTFASTSMTPESTPTTIFTTTATASSSVYIGDETSTTSTVSLLATTSDTPVETKLPWSIHLSKMDNACYTGQRLTTLSTVRHLVDCAARCIRDITCNGVNFRKSTKQCDLVDDERISSTWQISSSVDCFFWEMVWKQ